jgi:hypothetical protein
MKKSMHRILILGTGVILAATAAALTHSTAVQSSQPGIDNRAAFFLQTTATPQPADQSEIGSTDGIVVMGLIIVLIVSIPILARRRQWMGPPAP